MFVIVLILAAIVGLLTLAVQILLKHLNMALDKAAKAESRARQAPARSRTQHVARISEQLAPMLPEFKYNPKDVQWVGGTVDSIVWNGLESGGAVEVVLLDIKTGNAQTSDRQKRIQEAVNAGRVRFDVYRFDGFKAL
jgi:predicted Holliday junction resolvase-like endonuclease